MLSMDGWMQPCAAKKSPGILLWILATLPAARMMDHITSIRLTMMKDWMALARGLGSLTKRVLPLWVMEDIGITGSRHTAAYSRTSMTIVTVAASSDAMAQ